MHFFFKCNTTNTDGLSSNNAIERTLEGLGVDYWCIGVTKIPNFHPTELQQQK